jgi:DNA-binding response OmpR family regulator
MKQALIVDRNEMVGDFAASVLREGEYELTVVDSLQMALALVSVAPYQLVLVSQPHLCPEVLWRMVDSIKRLSPESTLVLVQADNADHGFHSRAQRLGATVLSLPLGVRARAIEEATIG